MGFVRLEGSSTGSGEPILGALVRIKGSTLALSTGAQGRFSFDPPPPLGARVVAAAVGYYNQPIDYVGAPMRIELDPLLFDPDAPLQLIAPEECGACHPFQVEDWQGSAMAHSGRNAWVYDLYNGSGTPGGMGGFVYTRDSVHRDRNPSSECAACHAPERWVRSPGAALGPFSRVEESDTRGVACALCHTVAEVDVRRSNHPAFVDGVARLHRGSLVRFGVLSDVDYRAPARMRAAYQPQLTAELCSLCHQDAGDPLGLHRFDGPSSGSTFEEWRASPYADPSSDVYSTCAECHSVALPVPEACIDGDGTRRPIGQVRSHRFEGTTQEVLDTAFELRVEAEQAGRTLKVSVRVHNVGAGHHVPTGVTMRNVLLIVEAREADAKLELVGGPRLGSLAGVGDRADGAFAGLPGRLFAKINESASGEGPVLFTEAVRIRKDTRIPALQFDSSTYEFALSDEASWVELDVRLVYRRTWYAWARAKGWTKDGHGEPLADAEPPHFGRLIGQVARRIPIVPIESTGGCRAGSARSRLGVSIFVLLVGIAWTRGRRARPSARAARAET